MIGYLRTFFTREAMGQFVRMGLIGVLNTIAYFAFANLFRWVVGLSSLWSVVWAFLLATGLSYVLNRSWAFRIDGPATSLRESSSFYVVNLIALVVTAAMVQGAEIAFGPLDKLAFNAVNVLAAGIIMLPKFAAYRDVVFRRSLEASSANRRRS